MTTGDQYRPTFSPQRGEQFRHRRAGSLDAADRRCRSFHARKTPVVHRSFGPRAIPGSTPRRQPLAELAKGFGLPMEQRRWAESLGRTSATSKLQVKILQLAIRHRQLHQHLGRSRVRSRQNLTPWNLWFGRMPSTAYMAPERSPILFLRKQLAYWQPPRYFSLGADRLSRFLRQTTAQRIGTEQNKLRLETKGLQIRSTVVNGAERESAKNIDSSGATRGRRPSRLWTRLSFLGTCWKKD